MAEGSQWLPGGASSDYRLGSSALVLDHAEGALLFDVDGNRLIDYYLGAGPIILGHDAPVVIEAVTRQLGRGVQLGGETRRGVRGGPPRDRDRAVRRDGPLRQHRQRGGPAGIPDRPRRDRPRHDRQVRGALPRLARQRLRRPAGPPERGSRWRPAPAHVVGRAGPGGHRAHRGPALERPRRGRGAVGAWRRGGGHDRAAVARLHPARPGLARGPARGLHPPRRGPDLRRDRVRASGPVSAAARACSASRRTSRPMPRRWPTASSSRPSPAGAT